MQHVCVFVRCTGQEWHGTAEAVWGEVSTCQGAWRTPATVEPKEGLEDGPSRPRKESALPHFTARPKGRCFLFMPPVLTALADGTDQV